MLLHSWQSSIYVSRKLRWDDWVGSQPASKSAKKMKINKNKKERQRRIEGSDYGGVHPSATERIAQRAFSRTLMNCRALFISLYLSISLSLFLFWLVLVPQSVRRLRLSPQLRGPVLCRSPHLLLLLRWPPFFDCRPACIHVEQIRFSPHTLTHTHTHRERGDEETDVYRL